MPDEDAATTMTRREVMFAVALAVAGALVAAGVALVWIPGALMVGGVLLAVWSWLLLGDIE